MTKCKAGYVRKLSLDQIVTALKKIEEGAFVPDIAREYGLTFHQVEGMIIKELLGKENIRYKRYGKRSIKFENPNVKAELSKLIEEGYDDDQIAELWSSYSPTIKRGRSTCGLVKWHRICANGHHSPHEYSHAVDVEGINRDNEDIEAIFLDSVVHNIKRQFQIPLEFNETEIIESNLDKEQVLVNTSEETRLMKQKWIDKNLIIQESENELTIVVQDSETIRQGASVMKVLVDQINWREIALRLQNPNMLYVVKDQHIVYYFEQQRCDASSRLVEVKLVREVKHESAKKEKSL